MVGLIKDRRGSAIEVVSTNEAGDADENIMTSQMVLSAVLPWQEVVCDLNDQVKNLSAGYASFNYEACGYAESDLVKVEILVNGEQCDPLSVIAHSSKADSVGRKLIIKLKDLLDRQQFEIVLQAKVGSKVSVV
jgi:translation elongation factor EF-4